MNSKLIAVAVLVASGVGMVLTRQESLLLMPTTQSSSTTKLSSAKEDQPNPFGNGDFERALWRNYQAQQKMYEADRNRPEEVSKRKAMHEILEESGKELTKHNEDMNKAEVIRHE